MAERKRIKSDQKEINNAIKSAKKEKILKTSVENLSELGIVEEQKIQNEVLHEESVPEKFQDGDDDNIKVKEEKLPDKVEVDVPNPIMQAKPLTGINGIKTLIENARRSLEAVNLQDAKAAYIKVIKIYNSLSSEDKMKVYNGILELYDDRKNAERIMASH